MILHRTRTWSHLLPPSPADRMQRYSGRRAAELRALATTNAAKPRLRVIAGRATLIDPSAWYASTPPCRRHMETTP